MNYKVTIDRAVIDDNADFIVKLYPDAAYQHLNIPRDTFLNASEMQLILDNEIEGSCVGTVKSLTSLKYGSYNAAVNAFQDSVNSDVIVPERMAYYVPGKLPRRNGYPHFIGFGTIDRSRNECISGDFNLVTGESSANMTPCSIE